MVQSILINNLSVEKEFYDFLTSTSSRSKIAIIILSLSSNMEVNYIKTTDKVDMVTYLPKYKQTFIEEREIDPYSDGIGRVYIKVGRLINKMFDRPSLEEFQITGLDIETFVNSFRSFFDKSNQKMMIVEGEDIRKWYLDKNYYAHDGEPTGNIWNSCMRYRDRQPYLDLYCVNPNQIKMLVMLIDDKVRSRALLWEAETNDGVKIKIMDRVYSTFDSDVISFKDWARKNGYISKYYQNAKSHQIFDIDDKEVILNLRVRLENFDLSYYPYLDTFPYFNQSLGIIYNNTNVYYDYTLIQTNGDLVPPTPQDEEPDDYGDFVDDGNDYWNEPERPRFFQPQPIVDPQFEAIRRLEPQLEQRLARDIRRRTRPAIVRPITRTPPPLTDDF